MPIYEENRPWRQWYGLKLWKDLRTVQLNKQPLCERCKIKGILTTATVINHKIAHKGDWDLFKDANNLESVCKKCHDGEIQKEEKTGFKGVGLDGWNI